ncbi:MAG: hypothetical protein EBU33_11185, partial [Sphingobacteriia bacterium]|nr:hypothetical protein [Sphingobacteriia bacterium]
YGPWGAPIAGGAYLAQEGMRVNAATKDALSSRNFTDDKSDVLDLQGLGGINELTAKKKTQQLLARVTGRTSELQNRKSMDEKDFSGFYGQVMRPFSPKQFTKEDSKRLVESESIKSSLSKALSSGDSKQMLKVLEDIQASLANKFGDVSKNQNVTESQSAAPMTSEIKVDISLKDSGKISDEIQNSIIAPIMQQLQSLQAQVNQLTNVNNPRPASV